MEEIYSKVVAIIIGCIALFIIPVKILAWRQDNMQQTYILTETICFVDSVCNKGILYSDLYIDYLNKIQKSDKIYKVKLEHIKNSENSIRMFYQALAVILFVIALSILFNIDRLMEKEYRYIQYSDRYREVRIRLKD